MIISIRGVDKELFREFSIEAKRRGITIGEAANEALRAWAQRHEGKKLGLLGIKPWSFGPGTENLSQEVDEILAEEIPRRH